MKRIIASLAAGALLIACSACDRGCSAAPAPGAPSAAMADPPRDAAFPARNRQLLIPSGGEEMNALFLLAAGDGPKPTMVLLHGLPGNERNLDLAQAVRRAGWNVLTFTYRGAWGSQGIFSIEHAIADTGAAMDFLRRPETIARYGIDPKRIVVAGHSMGGLAAAQQAARDEDVAGLVLLDAWDAGATARELREGGAAARDGFISGLDDLGHAIGTVSAADLADELIRRGEPWRFDAIADRLARKPVLTVYATHGGAAENRAFAETLRGKAGSRVTAVEIDSDHAFADSRIRLEEEVVRWLERISRDGGAARK